MRKKCWMGDLPKTKSRIAHSEAKDRHVNPQTLGRLACRHLQSGGKVAIVIFESSQRKSPQRNVLNWKYCKAKPVHAHVPQHIYVLVSPKFIVIFDNGGTNACQERVPRCNSNN